MQGRHQSKESNLILFLYILLSLVFCFEYTAAINIDYLLILPLVLICLFFLVLTNEKTIYSKELFGVSLFLFMILGHRVWQGALKGILISLFCILFLFLYRKKFSIKYFFKVQTVCSFVLAISCIFEYFFFDVFSSVFFKLLSADTAESLTTIFLNTMNVAGLTPSTAFTAGVLVVGLFSVLFTWNERAKLKNLLLCVIIAVGILLTGKRAHLIFPVIAFLIYYVMIAKGNKKIDRLISVVFLATVLVVLFMFIAPLFSDIDSIARTYSMLQNIFSGGDINDSISGRGVLYENAIVLWHQNILLGSGWGTFQSLTGMSTMVHNIYLQLLCETGIIGLSLFVISVTTSLLYTNKQLRFALNCKNIEKAQALKFSLVYQLFFLLYGISGNCLFDYSYLLVYVFAITIPFIRDYV